VRSLGPQSAITDDEADGAAVGDGPPLASALVAGDAIAVGVGAAELGGTVGAHAATTTSRVAAAAASHLRPPRRSRRSVETIMSGSCHTIRKPAFDRAGPGRAAH
jgi:hypothetical protein